MMTHCEFYTCWKLIPDQFGPRAGIDVQLHEGWGHLWKTTKSPPVIPIEEDPWDRLLEQDHAR